MLLGSDRALMVCSQEMKMSKICLWLNWNEVEKDDGNCGHDVYLYL